MVKKTTDEDLKRAVLKDIETAENYYTERIQPAVEEAVEVYNASEEYYDEKFPELSKRSKFTTKDVANTVEAVMPDLMRLLLGGNDVVAMRPQGAEDVENGDTMQELVKHQFMKLNKGYKLTSRWVKASLYKKLSVIKCTWAREVEWEKQTHTFDLNNPEDWQQYVALTQQINEGKVKAGTSKEFENGFFQIECSHEKVTKNQPQLDYMSHTEFIFIPVNIEINDSPFTAQRVTRTVDYLRKKQAEGIYSKADVDAVIASSGYGGAKNYSSTDDTQYETDKATYEDDASQKARKPIMVYECYGMYDMDGSETTQPMIITIANGIILNKQKNTDLRHPFFPMMALLEADDIIGKCMSDLIADFQHLKTAMLRQVIINTGLSNKPKYFYNSNSINGKYLSEDLEYIPVNAEKGTSINNMVVQEQVTQIAPWTLKLLEYNDTQKQETSGVTSYSMGIGGDVNESGTKGEAQILNQNGNKRVQMIARNMVETGFIDLFEHMVNLNLKYIDQEQVMRLLGKPLQTDPAQFAPKYDVTVSAGLGMGSSEQNLQAMQVVGQFFAELAPMLQLFMTKPILYDKFRNQKATMLEEMGIKDIDKYLPTREELLGQGQPQQPPMMGGGQPQPQGNPMMPTGVNPMMKG